MELRDSMIMAIKLKNFKSYKDEAEFSFYALPNTELSGNYSEFALNGEEIVRALNAAVILGANASGKSNVIWAFRALNYLIRQSRSFERNHKISAYDAFAFDEQFEKAPVEITVELIVKGQKYTYAIEFNDVIHKESLTVENGSLLPTLVFSRDTNDGDNVHHILIGEGWTHEIPEWVSMDIMTNHLILSELSSKRAYELNDVYEALAYINVFIHPVDMRMLNDQIAPIVIKSSSTEIFHRLIRLIRVADLGIKDISMIRHNDDEFNIPDFVSESQKRKLIEDNRWEFRAYHKYINSQQQEGFRPWDLKNESMGTQHLFGLGAVILSVLEMGSLLVYDELNMALHPEITRLLVRLFQNPETNPNHAQLLFTTHDASVIGESLMRCDQVWLAEKDKNGCSHLFSIQDFEDVPIVPPMEQWYRSGRFGALPNINQVHYIFTGEVNE